MNSNQPYLNIDSSTETINNEKVFGQDIAKDLPGVKSDL